MQIKFACRRGTHILLCVVIAALVCILPVFSACNSVIRRQLKYRFVYCFAPTVAAPSSESTGFLKDMGYAGYALYYGGEYYNIAALAVTSGEAENLAASLTTRGVSAEVLTAERLNFELVTYSAENNSVIYADNIDSLSDILTSIRECAELFLRNGRGAVRGRLISLYSRLTALCAANISNCFTDSLVRLSQLAAVCAYGVTTISGLRYLEVAVADTLLNICLA